MTLVEAPVDVQGPPGRVYSTRPQEALSREMGSVILKGPDLRVVFAEAAAYALARELRLDVPECGLCRLPDDGEMYFCSKKLRGRYPPDYWLRNGLLVNPELIARTIAFDVWVANSDRNTGNFVQEPATQAGNLNAAVYDSHASPGMTEAEEPRVRFFAIDFERSAALSGTPDRFTVTGWPSSRFWPVEDLGRLCREVGVGKPDEFIARICQLGADVVAGILERTVMDLDLAPVTWLGGAIGTLESRAANLSALASEAWDG